MCVKLCRSPPVSTCCQSENKPENGIEQVEARALGAAIELASSPSGLGSTVLPTHASETVFEGEDVPKSHGHSFWLYAFVALGLAACMLHARKKAAQTALRGRGVLPVHRTWVF